MKNPLPVPYYVTHAIVALAIDAATWVVIGGPTGIGGGFYAVREVIQWRQKGYWDSPGFWWPVIASCALTAIWWAS